MTFALWAVVGSAVARRFEINPGERGFRITWTSFEALIQFGEAPVLIRCPVTLEGTLHSRTVSKVSGLLIGYITRAKADEAACVSAAYAEEEGGGSALAAKLQFLTGTLPWHVRYQSFTGTLPRISGISVALMGSAIRVNEVVGSECLYGTIATIPMRYILRLNEAGSITAFRPDETAPRLPKVSGSIFCALIGMAYGGQSGTVTQLGNTAGIVVRLVN